MMKAKALGLALALGCGLAAGAATTASAAPAGAYLLGLSTSGSALELAQYKKRGFNRYRHGYRPGSRHAKPPRNWRRYDRRPGDWSRRGCIVVGPIWYCP